MMLTEIAYAKINLALHVRARRADGYHELETLFAFLDDGDRLTVAPAQGFSLSISGPFAAGLSAGEDNLVLRAARLLAVRNGVIAGAAFTLEKRLPVASGIGGGSADAAAALRLAARLWGLGPGSVQPADIALELGADVPACVLSRTCFGTGVGENLERIDADDLKGQPMLLVNPGVSCLTGPVFRGWDGLDRGPLAASEWRTARNDLQAPAISLCPPIAEVLAALLGTSPRLSRMSGSGATCFALFDTPPERKKAAAAIAAVHPEWWQMSGCLR